MRKLAAFQLSPQQIQSGVLQQHDGLSVDDFATLDHCKRFIHRQFQHLDIFAFVGEAAALTDFCHRIVVGDEKCSFSVTEPGLMKASNTLRTSCTR